MIIKVGRINNLFFLNLGHERNKLSRMRLTTRRGAAFVRGKFVRSQIDADATAILFPSLTATSRIKNQG